MTKESQRTIRIRVNGSRGRARKEEGGRLTREGKKEKMSLDEIFRNRKAVRLGCEEPFGAFM
jgi:hypothetical protein